MSHIKICIQNLGKYNEGELLFKWLSLPATEQEISDALDYICITHETPDGELHEFFDDFGCPYEEMHMPDWECDIDGIPYREWARIGELNELAERLDDLTQYDLHHLEAYLDYNGGTVEDALDNMEDDTCWYEGWTESEVIQDYVNEWLDQLDVPDVLKTYFDYDMYARDNFRLHSTAHGVLVDLTY